MSNPNHLRLTKLALTTGFRRSELLSLSWRNLDLEKNKIYVQRKECAARGSSSSMRIVPLPLKAKKLQKGLLHLCEEGVAQLFTRSHDSRMIIGVVGMLQFEVIQFRLKAEYAANCRFEQLNFIKAVWISAENDADLEQFINQKKSQIAKDADGKYVYLAETQWSLDREIREQPELVFKFSSEI